MTVSELIEVLERLPKNAKVMIRGKEVRDVSENIGEWWDTNGDHDLVIELDT